MTISKHLTRAVCGAAFAALTTTMAVAAYPEAPVRMIVPFAAGSATDTLARILGEAAAPILGQAIVIDNKPGADGTTGTAELRNRRPDGYTVALATSSPISIAPALRKSMPYNGSTDFTVLTTVASYSYVLFVNTELPVRNYKEFIDYVRARPGKVNYATGNMTTIAFNAQMKALNGLDMLAVPYRGEPDGVVALMSGDVQSMWSTMSVGLPHVRSGKVRALVTSTPERSPLLPAVPTIAETGLAPFTVDGWAVLIAPPGLPEDVAAKITAAFTAALASPAVVDKLVSRGFVPAPRTPAQSREFIKTQTAEYLRVLRSAGVEPE